MITPYHIMYNQTTIIKLPLHKYIIMCLCINYLKKNNGNMEYPKNKKWPTNLP
jgi:kynurenine formamidase